MPGPGYIIVAIRVANMDSAALEHKVRGQSAKAYASTATEIIKRDKRKIISGLKDVLNGLAGGTMRGDLWIALPGTNAVVHRRTITCTQATSAGAAVTFTCGAATVVLTEGVAFARGASDTTEAAALAAAINADPTLGRIFVADNSAGVTRVDAKFPGQLWSEWVTTGGTGFVVAITGGATIAGTLGTARTPLRNVVMGKTP